MFTGLVEEIGEVISLEESNMGIKISIKCEKIVKNSKLGDSIATNGTCLTITNMGDRFFQADVMYESIKKTNLKRLKIGDRVNLEKSITLNSLLGGHLVTGDVDGEGVVIDIYSEGIAKIYVIKIDPRLMKYVVEKGRITLDGASLTLMDISDDSISVSLIPFTQEKITLGSKNRGDFINIETDLIGKYVEKIMSSKKECEQDEKKVKNRLTEEFLTNNGF